MTTINKLFITAIPAMLFAFGAFATPSAVSNASAETSTFICIQTDSTSTVEVQPVFPGGQAALMNFIAKNMRYPYEALDNGIGGKIFVQFTVDKDGSITNVKTVNTAQELAEKYIQTLKKKPNKKQTAGILKAYEALTDEATRVVCAMPNWQPGMQKGQPVRTRYTVPVTFRMQ
jgi:protein TonB